MAGLTGGTGRTEGVVLQEGRQEAGPEVSVVVPVYRTGWALAELARRLRETMEGAGLSYELLVVDDASPDGALATARELEALDPRVRVLALERNLGQHRAVLQGFAASRGRWVVALDGDLQDPPEAIPRLLALANQGHDVVFATRAGRYQSRGRMWTSRGFKELIHRLFGLPRGAGLYLLLRREVAERVVAAADDQPSVVVLAGLEATDPAGLPVERAERRQGRSAYSSWGRLVAALSSLRCGWRHLRHLRHPRRRPANASGALQLAACFLVATAVAAALALSRPFDFGDEGFRLLLSADWARGVHLFEKYRLQYLPGQYVLYGSLFRVFGEGWGEGWGDGYVAGRLAGALMVGLSATLVFSAVRRLATVRWAWLAGLGVAVVAFPRPATLASTLVLVVATDLARRLHDGSAATAPMPMPAALRLHGLLNVLQVRLRRPRRRAPCIHEHLRRFATSNREISGLARRWRRPGGVPVGPGWVVGVSALAGLVAGLREDAAVLLTAIAVLAVVGRRRPGDLLRLVLPAMVAGFLPWVAVFALRGEAGAFVTWVVHRMLFLGERLARPTRPGWALPRHPLSSFAAFKITLFPLLATLPAVLYLALAGREAFRWLRSRALSAPAPAALAAALAGAAHLPQFLWERPDQTHLHYHAHLEAAVVVVALATLAPRWRRAGATVGTACLCLCVAVAVARRAVEPLAPYPAAAGRGMEVLVRDRPPGWAPLPARPGETLIVLDWGPGWYTVEGLPTGTRYLYTGERNDLLPTQVAELAHDLEAPSNRWVITRSLASAPAAVVRTLERCYHRRGVWQRWRLWARRPCSAPTSEGA